VWNFRERTRELIRYLAKHTDLTVVWTGQLQDLDPDRIRIFETPLKFLPLNANSPKLIATKTKDSAWIRWCVPHAERTAQERHELSGQHQIYPFNASATDWSAGP
jgi:hypothetical protein